jgi:transcriptional regulator with XRE-family HTH domain
MSQQRLATLIGVRFQQVQKYETGANRISASRLWEASKALEVPITYFFDSNQTASADISDENSSDTSNSDFDCSQVTLT